MKVTIDYDRRKLTNIVNMLAEAKLGRNLRKKDVVEVAEGGLAVLKDNFPDTNREGSALKREFGDIKSKWKVLPTSRGFGFEIANTQAKQSRRLNQVLEALNYGSRAYVHTVEETQRFQGKLSVQPRTRKGLFGRKYTWITLIAGREIRYPAKPGKKFVGKAIDHIEQVMLPRLATTLRERAERKISNG